MRATRVPERGRWPRRRRISVPGRPAGIDDQEGRAVLLEERAGLLGPRRRKQLAARHWAVEAMHGGASFADVASALTAAHGLDAQEAVVVAERAFRGGDGSHPGLGRERVYLESLVRVRRHLAARPHDDAVLASGQVAVDAVETLRPLLGASSRERCSETPVSGTAKDASMSVSRRSRARASARGHAFRASGPWPPAWSSRRSR